MPDIHRLEGYLADFVRRPVGDFEKGVPPYTGLSLIEIGQQGWMLPGGDIPLPALALRWEPMLRNIARFQSFCDGHGVRLAPHGKTTMAPQIFLEQLRAGAWAITVATARQALVCSAFGVPRILLANEPTTPADFASIADLLNADPGPELLIFVDDPEVIKRLAAALRRIGVARSLSVLIEFGFVNGRGGIRRLEDVDSLVDACAAASPEVVLVGIAGYEGIVDGSDPTVRLQAVDGYLTKLGRAARRLRDLDPSARLVSAGGSVFFDRVVELLGPEALPDSELVLRSGAYVTQDHGIYDLDSPLGSSPDRRLPGEPLEPALELWSAVVSRQEPELAILGFGRRDAPTDSGLPKVLGVWETDRITPLDANITALNDQHAFLSLTSKAELEPGDNVVCGISHPCTVFEKWRTVLAVDEKRQVTGAVRTLF